MIDPTLLAEYRMLLIPSTGILQTINPNALYNNDDGAEVSSSSNVTSASGSGNGTSTRAGTTSSNSSIATTMDLSLNSQNANDESHSSDPNDVDEQPAKKARLSTVADNDERIPIDQTNDDGQNKDKRLEAGTTGSNECATISMELFEQMRNAKLCCEHQIKQMTDLLDAKTFDIERLEHEKQALVDENDQLKKHLEEKTPHQIDRAALIELAKTTKVCVGCNTERPSDMLHFCDIGCQKSYL